MADIVDSLLKGQHRSSTSPKKGNFCQTGQWRQIIFCEFFVGMYFHVLVLGCLILLPKITIM